MCIDYLCIILSYKEGDEAGYLAVSEESGDDAADVGPSGAGLRKEVLKLLAPLGGPRRVRQAKAGRPFVLTPPKIFRWSP